MSGFTDAVKGLELAELQASSSQSSEDSGFALWITLNPKPLDLGVCKANRLQAPGFVSMWHVGNVPEKPRGALGFSKNATKRGTHRASLAMIMGLQKDGTLLNIKHPNQPDPSHKNRK